MKSKYFIIACVLIILSLLSAGYKNPRTVTISPREPIATMTAVRSQEEQTPAPAQSETDTVTTSEQTPQITESNTRYILNMNTKRFHYPDCASVQQMKEANKKSYEGTREELIDAGYTPCGNCHP